MPIYEFLCSDQFCNHKTESIYSIANSPNIIKCEVCGKDAKKVPSLISDLHNRQYDMPNAGPNGFKGSYSEKQQFLREHNLKEAGDTVGGSRETAMQDHYKQGLKDYKARADASFKKSFADAVKKTTSEM